MPVGGYVQFPIIFTTAYCNGVFTRQPLLGATILAPCHVLKYLQLEYEDRARVHEIFGCLIFNWGVVTWLKDRVLGY